MDVGAVIGVHSRLLSIIPVWSWCLCVGGGEQLISLLNQLDCSIICFLASVRTCHWDIIRAKLYLKVEISKKCMTCAVLEFYKIEKIKSWNLVFYEKCMCGFWCSKNTQSFHNLLYTNKWFWNWQKYEKWLLSIIEISQLNIYIILFHVLWLYVSMIVIW